MTETKFGGNHSHTGYHESYSFLQLLIFCVMLMPHGTHEVWLPIVLSLHKQRRRNSLHAKELALSKSTVGDNSSIMSVRAFWMLRFVSGYWIILQDSRFLSRQQHRFWKEASPFMKVMLHVKCSQISSLNVRRFRDECFCIEAIMSSSWEARGWWWRPKCFNPILHHGNNLK